MPSGTPALLGLIHFWIVDSIPLRRNLLMAMVAIKTSTGTGYCDCIHGCYELASLRDEETGKGFCPACGKDHQEMNKGLGIASPPPSKLEIGAVPKSVAAVPEVADPPGRLRQN
jgi:hypothetical protein